MWFGQQDVTGLCVGLKTQRRVASVLKLTANLKTSWPNLAFNTLHWNIRSCAHVNIRNKLQTLNMEIFLSQSFRHTTTKVLSLELYIQQLHSAEQKHRKCTEPHFSNILISVPSPKWTLPKTNLPRFFWRPNCLSSALPDRSVGSIRTFSYWNTFPNENEAQR